MEKFIYKKKTTLQSRAIVYKKRSVNYSEYKTLLDGYTSNTLNGEMTREAVTDL